MPNAGAFCLSRGNIFVLVYRYKIDVVFVDFSYLFQLGKQLLWLNGIFIL